MPSILPSPHQFLTSLLTTPPFHPPSSPTPNPPLPLFPLNPITKPLFLTLHCLFPSELLPALDLLDRRLVTRIILTPPVPSTTSAVDSSTAGEPLGNWGCAALYRVRSSHQSRRSHSAALQDRRTGISYEVRTKAWNCTCPAFTFAAFEYEGGGWGWESGGRLDGAVDHGKVEKNADEGRLGGLMLEDQMPVCKHLLACVLVERCVSLEEHVETRLVGREEMAGLAVGLGE